MAKTGPSSAFLLIDGYDFLAAKVATFNAKTEALTEQNNGLGDGNEAHGPTGLSRVTVSQAGGFFDTTAGSIHDAMAAKLPTSPQDADRVLCVGMMGQVLAAGFWGIKNAGLVAYEVLLQLTALTKANVVFAATGLLERGQILLPLTAKAADSTGTTVDYAADPLQRVIPITSNTAANPSVVTTPVAHGLTTGQKIVISGVSLSNADINGEQTVTVISTTTFSVAVDATTHAGTGGSFVLASTVNGGAGYQHVTAYSGLTSIANVIRHSSDDSTYVDLVTFTSVTAANKAERITAAGTIRRYLKFNVDVTGTGSATVFGGFARS